MSRPRRTEEEPASILVIRRDNIGDLVCTTPALNALRRHFPKARICVLVNTYNRTVLERNPDVDAVYVYEKAKHRTAGTSLWRVYWNTLRLILKLQRERFDYVLLAGSRDFPQCRYRYPASLRWQECNR